MGSNEQLIKKLDAQYAYAQKLMDVGIEIAAQAHVEVGEKWARDPKVIALALLSRTLGHLKAAISLLQQHLPIEANILIRCCVENLICIGALQRTGDMFVEELLRADAAWRTKSAKLAIDAFETNQEQPETVVRLKELVATINATYPKAQPLNAKKLSEQNPVGSSYILFSVLSQKASHVSVTTLGRHIERDLEDGSVYLRIQITPDPKDEQITEALAHLLRTVLTIVVGANQIIGGTDAGRKLSALTDEFQTIN